MICNNCKKEVEEWGEHVVFVSILRRGVPVPLSLVDAPNIGSFRKYNKYHPAIPVIGVMEFEQKTDPKGIQ